MKDKNKLNELIKKSRKLAFPGMTLCCIEFDDKTQTNDFIPDEVLKNPNLDNAIWWNKQNKETYIPLIEGRIKAIKAMPIPEH